VLVIVSAVVIFMISIKIRWTRARNLLDADVENQVRHNEENRSSGTPRTFATKAVELHHYRQENANQSSNVRTSNVNEASSPKGGAEVERYGERKSVEGAERQSSEVRNEEGLRLVSPREDVARYP